MKKLITLSLLMLLSFVAFPQTKVDSVAVKDTSKLSYSKVYSDVKTAITAIAANLKVGAEHVYTVLVKQQVVYAITYLALDIVIILAIFLLFKGALHFNKLYQAELETGEIRSYETTFNEVVRAILFAATLILFVIGGISVFMTADDVITGFVNPEYGALQDIVSWIK